MDIRSIALVFLLFGSIIRPATAGFIGNGGFEDVPGDETGQGLLASGWLTATAISPGADTYSADGSYGLAPDGFGNFPGVTAFAGGRWAAGAAFGRMAASAGVGGEAFGTNLLEALTPGAQYVLNAFLFQALRSDINHAGGYDLFLAVDDTPGGLSTAVLLGALGQTTGSGEWEARSLTFVAPADAAARAFLVFAPYQAGDLNAYPGIDAISLESMGTAVPEPGSTALFTLAAAGVLVARRRRRSAIICN